MFFNVVYSTNYFRRYNYRHFRSSTRAVDVTATTYISPNSALAGPVLTEAKVSTRQRRP